MQLIDTPTGHYCIADGRSAADFIKALKAASKPKRPRLSTARPLRRFPTFYAGKTSTADYVRDLFGELPTTPASCPTDESDENTYMVAVC